VGALPPVAPPDAEDPEDPDEPPRPLEPPRAEPPLPVSTAGPGPPLSLWAQPISGRELRAPSVRIRRDVLDTIRLLISVSARGKAMSNDWT
jgi:hypothetical protein